MQSLFRSRCVMWMPFSYPWRDVSDTQTHCCDDMHKALHFTCEQHSDPYECGDYALIYHPLFCEYGLIIRDGGMSYLLIDYCPFCGSKLPERRRDWWFDELERRGIDDIEVDFANLPDDLQRDIR